MMIKESIIEKKSCAWAKLTFGIRSFKITTYVGVPDRLFLHKGKVIFVEFKRLGEKPRVIQEHVHRVLRDEGFTVYVVDNFESFKLIVKEWTNAS